MTAFQPTNGFVFHVPLTFTKRLFALAMAGIFLLAAAYLPLRLGLSRFADGLGNHPFGIWSLYLMLAAAIGLFLILAFPPPSARPELQFRRDLVRFVPERVERRIFGERPMEAPITPQSREIIFCHNFLEELPDGYTIVVRAVDGSDREVKARVSVVLTEEESLKLASGITGATTLPVRFVIRRRLADGSVQETPWTPKPLKALLVNSVAMSSVLAVPYVGGVIVAYLRLPLQVAGTVGLVLWLGQIVANYTLSRKRSAPTRVSGLNLLVSFFIFAIAYTLIFVVVGFLIRHL